MSTSTIKSESILKMFTVLRENQHVSRRYRAIHLSYPLLQDLFTTGWNNVEDGYVAWCVDGLPEGAQLVRTFNDDRRGVAVLIFEPESFEPVELGDEVPAICPVYRREALSDVIIRNEGKLVKSIEEGIIKHMAKVTVR